MQGLTSLWQLQRVSGSTQLTNPAICEYLKMHVILWIFELDIRWINISGIRYCGLQNSNAIHCVGAKFGGSVGERLNISISEQASVLWRPSQNRTSDCWEFFSLKWHWSNWTQFLIYHLYGRWLIDFGMTLGKAREGFYNRYRWIHSYCLTNTELDSLTLCVVPANLKSSVHCAVLLWAREATEEFSPQNFFVKTPVDFSVINSFFQNHKYSYVIVWKVDLHILVWMGKGGSVNQKNKSINPAQVEMHE